MPVVPTNPPVLLLVGGLAIFINLGAEHTTNDSAFQSKSDLNSVVSYDCERGAHPIPQRGLHCTAMSRSDQPTSLISIAACFLPKVSIIWNPLSRCRSLSSTIIYSLSSLAAACSSCSRQAGGHGQPPSLPSLPHLNSQTIGAEERTTKALKSSRR